MARSSSFNSVMKARDDDAPMQGRGSDLPISPYVHHSTCSSEVSAPRRERCDLAAQPVTPSSRIRFGALPTPSPLCGAPSRDSDITRSPSFEASTMADRKSTRLNPVTNAHLVCRLLLEQKKKQKKQTTSHR